MTEKIVFLKIEIETYLNLHDYGKQTNKWLLKQRNLCSYRINIYTESRYSEQIW